MKNLAAGLVASLALEGGTLCTLVKITLATGRIVALADHDVDVILDGLTYTASYAFELSSIAIHDGTQNSSLEFSSLLDPAIFDRNDITSGVLDRAQFEAHVMDYAAPQNGSVLYYAGRVQQISFSDDVTAVLQIASLLDQNVQLAYEQFSYNCTADLGDARCKVNIAALSKAFTVAADSEGQAFTSDLTDDNATWNTGLVEFTTGLNEGFAVEIGQYSKNNGAVVLKLPLPYAIAAGDKGTIYPGCDKTPNTCLKTYNNINNYRGVPIGIDPSLGNSATTTLDNAGLAQDQQPPGKVGVYNALDGSFGWYDPAVLPPLPTTPLAGAGSGNWVYSPVSQFVRYPLVGSNTKPKGAVIIVTIPTAPGNGYSTGTDSARAYGSKFEFNGFVIAYYINPNSGGA